MLPEIIIHNSVTLDNAFTADAFLPSEIDIGLHYEILLSFRPDAVLMGSGTAAGGIEMSGDLFIPEREEDLIRPEFESKDVRPYSILVDSKGHLMGKLHFYRNLEHVKDVIVLISKKTPLDYINYLKERDYDFVISGSDNVDIKDALLKLNYKYGFQRIVSDSGSLLNGALLNAGLAKKLSLLVYPFVGKEESRKLFENVKNPLNLKLTESRVTESGIIHLLYNII